MVGDEHRLHTPANGQEDRHDDSRRLAGRLFGLHSSAVGMEGRGVAQASCRRQTLHRVAGYLLSGNNCFFLYFLNMMNNDLDLKLWISWLFYYD